MSIKTRLLLSNIGMIVIPFLSIFIIDIVLVYVFFLFDYSFEENRDIFFISRIISFLAVLIVTNGLLAYVVSKSIILPIQKLSKAADEIADGNLNFSIKVNGKDEISQLAQNFETMRLKLKETEELNKKYELSRQELIASISHDLKTPITSIKGYISGIKDGVANTPEKMEKYIDTIANKTTELEYLIDELFLYSKYRLNKVPYHFEQMDMNAYLQDYLEELRFTLTERGGSVSYHVNDEENFVVKADRNQIYRVITNIIQNALKYTDDKNPIVEVNLSTTNKFVKVEIKDNGIGIADEALPLIFNQFYRTDESRNTSTGGSGIGLAIVKQIVEDHGGKVWAESVEGIGTSVYFTLPKAGEEI